MSALVWHSDQKAADRQKATVAAELHTNTSLNIGEVNQVSPDTFTRLIDVLDRIERRLDAPGLPGPSVRSFGIHAGSTQTQQLVLPPWAAWALDTLALLQLPGATGTFSVTVSGLLYSDFALTSDPSGVQSKELGIPVQQSASLVLTETGAGTAGAAALYLVFAPLERMGGRA